MSLQNVQSPTRVQSQIWAQLLYTFNQSVLLRQNLHQLWFLEGYVGWLVLLRPSGTRLGNVCPGLGGEYCTLCLSPCLGLFWDQYCSHSLFVWTCVCEKCYLYNNVSVSVTMSTISLLCRLSGNFSRSFSVGIFKTKRIQLGCLGMSVSHVNSVSSV